MNEQTPRDPQQPVGANDPTPQQPAAQPTDAQPTTQQPVANPAADGAPRRGRGILKPVLIGTGAAVAVLAVAGIGVAVADALGDPDEQPRTQPGVTAPMTSGGSAHESDDGHDDGAGSGEGMGSMAPADVRPLAAAPQLVDAIDAAIAAAGGGGATSIDVQRDGWKVDVRLDDGSEVEVRVYADGSEAVVQQDDDDRSSDRVLDTSRIADVVDAAIAAAGGGVVQSIDGEDDDGSAFEVQVLLDGGRDVDVDLADDLSVVSVDD